MHAGVYSVELQHALPPAVLQASGVPASLAVGECATCTLVVAPRRTVSKGTPVWLQLAPRAPVAPAEQVALVDTEERPIPCRVFVGRSSAVSYTHLTLPTTPYV